jgi:hypothetical protein
MTAQPPDYKPTAKDIASMKATMENIENYNKKYHPEKTFDITDIIQYALPYSKHISPYRPRAEYIAEMIRQVLPRPHTPTAGDEHPRRNCEHCDKIDECEDKMCALCEQQQAGEQR